MFITILTANQIASGEITLKIHETTFYPGGPWDPVRGMSAAEDGGA